MPKILWAIVIIAVALGGWLWAVNNVLSPPPVQPPAGNNPAPSPPDSSPATPAASSPPTPVASSPSTVPAAPTPVASNPPASPKSVEPSPLLVPNSSSSSPVAESSSSPLPALALPNQPVLKVPSRLERGGVLNVYINNDANEHPDPVMYSPSRVLKTQGLTVLDLPRGQFQEVTGYFKVDQTGNYNFTLIPEIQPYLTLSDIHTRIDGSMLSTITGGRVALEEGWHQVSLFTDRMNVASLNVTWGREGETLKPLQVWRESK